MALTLEEVDPSLADSFFTPSELAFLPQVSSATMETEAHRAMIKEVRIGSPSLTDRRPMAKRSGSQFSGPGTKREPILFWKDNFSGNKPQKKGEKGSH